MSELREQLLADLLPVESSFDFDAFDVSDIATIKLTAEQSSGLQAKYEKANKSSECSSHTASEGETSEEMPFNDIGQSRKPVSESDSEVSFSEDETSDYVVVPSPAITRQQEESLNQKSNEIKYVPYIEQTNDKNLQQISQLPSCGDSAIYLSRKSTEELPLDQFPQNTYVCVDPIKLNATNCNYEDATIRLPRKLAANSQNAPKSHSNESYDDATIRLPRKGDCGSHFNEEENEVSESAETSSEDFSLEIPVTFTPVEVPVMPLMMLGPDGNVIPIDPMNSAAIDSTPTVDTDGQIINVPMIPQMFGPDGNMISTLQMPEMQTMSPQMLGPDENVICMPQIPQLMPPPQMFGPDGQSIQMFDADAAISFHEEEPHANPALISTRNPNSNPLQIPSLDNPTKSKINLSKETTQPTAAPTCENFEIPTEPAPLPPTTNETETKTKTLTPQIPSISVDPPERAHKTRRSTNKKTNSSPRGWNSKSPRNQFASLRGATDPSPRSQEPIGSSKFSTLRSVSADNTPSLHRKSTNDIDTTPTKPGIPPQLTPREQLTQTANNASKRELMRLEKSRKSIQRLQQRQKREFKVYKEKQAARLQIMNSKMEADVEKAKLQQERDIKAFEKQQAKTTKEKDNEFDEITRDTDRKQDKIQLETEKKWQTTRKELRNAFTEQKNSIIALQKQDTASKKRNKYTYDKKYLKLLKSSQKVELQVAEKIHLVEIEHNKLLSDAKLRLQQHQISCELVEATNRQLFHIQVELLGKRNENEMECFNVLENSRIELLDVFHREQVVELKKQQEFERKQFDKRFHEEKMNHDTMVQTIRAAKKKTQKTTGTLTKQSMKEIEDETQKLSEASLDELSEVQKTQLLLLQERFDDDLKKLDRNQRKEVFMMELDAAKVRLDMVIEFQRKERELFAERQERDMRSLREGQESVEKTNSTSQQEVFSHLDVQEGIIMDFVSKESKKCHQEFVDKFQKTIKDYFACTRDKLEKEYNAANAILSKRNTNSINALEELYELHTKNLDKKCEAEIQQKSSIVSSLTSQTPR